MANPHKGEVAFEANGKQYVFKLGTYAQAMLERRVKTTFGKFVARKEDDWGVDDALVMFWAGLYRQHKLTEEQAGDLLDEIGSDRLSEILTEALKISQPDEVGVVVDPPKAEAVTNGTGMPS